MSTADSCRARIFARTTVPSRFTPWPMRQGTYPKVHTGVINIETLLFDRYFRLGLMYTL